MDEQIRNGERAFIPKYKLSISLSALDDLGINLYSNIPAVLSELIANAWDADAETVDIRIDRDSEIITITDDGSGMNAEDINNKYLMVGYKKRNDENNPFATETPKGRKPMGRKGIGKLSVFSMAENVEVHSVKDGERNGLIMRVDDIRASIDKDVDYYPEAIPSREVAFNGTQGTKIVLKALKKDISQLETNLRRRVARRFTVWDNPNDNDRFEVVINGKPVSLADRDYYHKVEFVWYLGDESQSYADKCISATEKICLDNILEGSEEMKVTGWVGTVDERKSFRDGENTIVLYARNKLIHEDVIRDLKEGGVYTKYLIGDINADFMDVDDKADLVTSDRQSVKEHDPRYGVLREFIRGEILKSIERQWKNLRRKQGLKRATSNEKIKAWFKSLEGDHKQWAQQMFGRLESYKIDDQEAKKELYKSSILAFEKMALKNTLSKIDRIETLEDFELLRNFFTDIDEIEAVHYHQIASGRLEAINKLTGLADASAKEKAFQELIFEHLWLLDPSWERAAYDERIEEQAATAFEKVTDNLTEKEKNGRIDIRYRTAAGTHIIIELKKYDRRVSAFDLAKQVEKYKSALEKLLNDNHPEESRDIKIVCVLGKRPSPPESLQAAEGVLESINAKFITYDKLITDAQRSYKAYLEKNASTSKILELINSLDEDESLDARPESKDSDQL